MASEDRRQIITTSPIQLDVVVRHDGTVTVPAIEVARLGARPGEHLHLVRDEPAVSEHGRRKVRGTLAGKIDADDLLTEEDFNDAKRARIDATSAKFA